MAAAQHGIVTLAQLQALGFASSTVRARQAAGRLHRLHGGVDALGHPAVGARGHWLAAVLACGPAAVLSHRSAAALWGIRASAGTRIDVTSPTRAGRSRAGIAAHRADRLVAVETTILDAIPCTTVARTVFDLARCLSAGALEYAIHRAQAKDLLDRGELAAVLIRAAGSAGAVRRILALEAPGEDRSRSRLERRFLRICRAAGLPLPRVNLWLAGSDGHGLEVDFCWPDRRLVVETGSSTFHRTARAIETTRRGTGRWRSTVGG